MNNSLQLFLACGVQREKQTLRLDEVCGKITSHLHGSCADLQWTVKSVHPFKYALVNVNARVKQGGKVKLCCECDSTTPFAKQGVMSIRCATTKLL